MGNNLDNNNALLPPVKFWSFNFGEVPPETTVYTDVVDLGENSLYTFLVARKIGNATHYEYLVLQSSIDGMRWSFAPGEGEIWDDEYFIAGTALNQPSAAYCAWGRSIGRYVRVKFRNGSGVQNNLIIDLAAFAGIELGMSYNW